LGFGRLLEMTFDTRVLEADTLLPMLVVGVASRDLRQADFEHINRAVLHLLR
jgi:hypothetical protein